MATLLEVTEQTISIDINKLSKEEIEKYQHVFSSVDTDNSGTISIEELESLFNFLEIEINEEELKKIVSLVDVDKSGNLSFEEFVTLIHLINPEDDEDENEDEDNNQQQQEQQEQPQDNNNNNNTEQDSHRENLRIVFNSIDADQSGSISTDELGEMFSRLGYDINHEELEQLIKLVDDDRNGTLDFEEFVKLMDMFLQHIQNTQ